MSSLENCVIRRRLRSTVHSFAVYGMIGREGND